MLTSATTARTATGSTTATTFAKQSVFKFNNTATGTPRERYSYLVHRAHHHGHRSRRDHHRNHRGLHERRHDHHGRLLEE